MNPPFGGKEGKEAQAPFEYKTGSTQFPIRANGPRSWTIDFLDIQQRAIEKARPLREKAVAL